jgi:hypothetical protein
MTGEEATTYTEAKAPAWWLKDYQEECGAEIMLVASVWYKTRAADINGFCPLSPDDTHSPTPAE